MNSGADKTLVVVEQFDYPGLALWSQQALSDKIEATAWALGCDRHRPHIRGCVWRNDLPCRCRMEAMNV